MNRQDFTEILEALEFCREHGWTGFEQFYRDILNEADRTGRLPPEAYPEGEMAEPEPEAEE